jgi:CRP-like cAMP-binding protein
MSEIKDFLNGIEMFIGLSSEQLDEVAALCQARTFPANKVIIERNSPADSFFLIEDGIVKIIPLSLDEAEDQAEGVVVTLGQGQSFGEMGLIDSGARSATVQASTDTRLYEVNCNRFRTLCETDTDLGYLVMRNIAIDLSFKLRHRNLL